MKMALKQAKRPICMKTPLDPANPLRMIETRMRTFATRESLHAALETLLPFVPQGVTP
jgi:hypothetical protein